MTEMSGRMNLFGRLTRKLNLRQKLGIAFVIMTALPLLVTTIVTWRPYEAAMTLVVEKRNQEYAEKIALEMDWIFAEKKRMLALVANNEEVVSMQPARQMPMLGYIAAQYPDVQLAVTSDMKGRQIARWDGKPADPAINYEDREYFQELKKTGHSAISDVLVSRSTQKKGIVMAEPIRSPKGELVGALIINLELEKLLRRIGGTKIEANSATYVVNGQGKVIIHPERGLVENGTDESAVAPVSAALKQNSGWIEYESDGQVRLAGYCIVPDTEMIVVVQMPKAEAMAEVNAIKKRSLLVLMLAIGLAITIGLAIAGALAKPLADIAEAVKRLGEGDWSVRIAMSGQDEINRLAAAFNSLAEQLAKRDAALNSITQDLERQVAERTRELQLANEELKLVSQLDGLTGIANRRTLDEALQREWMRGLRDGMPLALIMLDADCFKAYNDAYGHQAGDECLKFIAAEVKKFAKRSSDLAARYGGEEFVLILEECDLKGAALIAEKLRSSIEAAQRPHQGSKVTPFVTVSLGVAAMVPQVGLSAESLIKAADQAMYAAKQSGRNRVCLADEWRLGSDK